LQVIKFAFLTGYCCNYKLFLQSFSARGGGVKKGKEKKGRGQKSKSIKSYKVLAAPLHTTRKPILL
jgi:hypothetical protein